jgi:3-oxoacyl-[acyl-carrier-protein] synthase-1
MRFTETDLMDSRFDRFTLGMVPEEGLPELADTLAPDGLTSREVRLLRLCAAAFSECLEYLPDAKSLPGLSLALPESETTRVLDGARFLKSLVAVTGRGFAEKHSDASHRGRAGGLAAIGQAIDMVSSGRVPVMIAGGIDTYRDPYILSTLDREMRVKSPTNLDGFIPGEGAAFLALSRAGEVPGEFAVASPVVLGHEAGHLYSEQPYLGDALASVVQQLLQAEAARGPVQEVYSSMNGENHWAKEWGVAFLRNSSNFSPDAGMNHPADCYGDTGAASGPLMTGLAALGIKERYRRSPALIYGSSDRGPRAAMIVSAPGEE